MHGKLWYLSQLSLISTTLARAREWHLNQTIINFNSKRCFLTQEEKKRKGKEKVNTPVLKVGGLKMISLSPTEILEKLCIIEDSRKSHTTSDPSSCKFRRDVSTRLYCCLLVNVNPQVE